MNEFLLFVVTGQSRLRTVHDTLLEIPIRLRITFDRDGQDGSLGARVPASLCPSAEHRFHKLMRIKKQIFDIAGGVHVGKDDLDVGAGDQGIRLGYASGGSGGSGRCLDIAVDLVEVSSRVDLGRVPVSSCQFSPGVVV